MNRNVNIINMLNIKNLENSWFFKKIILEKWELLFDEWDINNNLYIIKIWELKVEKYTDKNKNETKILWYIKSNEILWEASLNNNKEKEVKISANKKSYLLYINWKEWIDEFSKKYIEDSIELFKYMIYLWNKRLIDTNKLITINYKFNQELLLIKNISNKSIFEIIDKLVDILDISYILYYEINPIMNNFLILKYDTRYKWKMKNEIIEITEKKLDILKSKLNDFHNYIQNIFIWNINLWYLSFFKKEYKFSENEKKVLSSISTWFSWLIKQKLILEEERNKNFLKES